MKPVILFYGNCQAGALSGIFAADPVIAEDYDVLYIPNFDDRIPDAKKVGPEEIKAAAIFFDQHDWSGTYPHEDLLSPDCLRISFPSIDWHLLWPLECGNIFNEAPTPQWPWGRFPYGDRIVVEGIERGESAHEIRGHYPESSKAKLPPLDRYAELEFARLRARDAKCDVKMAEFVIENFREQNLFWCTNHPTLPALHVLCHRLIAAVAERSAVPLRESIDDVISKLDPEGPLGNIHVPVHPAVADHFQLQWYPRDGGKHYGQRGARMTYDEYYALMIEIGVNVRDLVNAGPA